MAKPLESLRAQARWLYRCGYSEAPFLRARHRQKLRRFRQRREGEEIANIRTSCGAFYLAAILGQVHRTMILSLE